ncbi:hypothetical protein R6Q59_009783 [Mikania micrantha]
MDPNQNPNYYNPNTPPNRNPNTPPPNWVFSPSPINPFFDSNCYRPNFDSSPQQGFNTFADYDSSQQPHGFGQLSQDEVVPETQPTTNAGPSTQPKQRRRHRKKQDVDTEPAVGASKRSKASSTDSPSTSDARVNINLNDLDEEEEDDDDEIEDLTRPTGRDRAKTDRERARRGSSSQTTPDYNQGIEHLSQRIGDFNELKQERQRSATDQSLIVNNESNVNDMLDQNGVEDNTQVDRDETSHEYNQFPSTCIDLKGRLTS